MTTYDVILPAIPEDVELLETRVVGAKFIWENTSNDSWYNQKMDSEVTLKHLLYHYGPATVVEKQYEIWVSYNPTVNYFQGTRKECGEKLQFIVQNKIADQFRLIEFQYLDGWAKLVNPYDLDREPLEYRIQAIDTEEARIDYRYDHYSRADRNTGSTPGSRKPRF